MRPIFTIHAGEYLVGNYLEENYKNIKIWVPSKDTGIDLLITSADCQRSVSLQVKFSKDYMNKEISNEIDKNIKSGGWWKFTQRSLEETTANYWVMVLYRFQNKEYDFIVIQPKELLNIYDSLDRQGQKDKKIIHSYVWVTNNNPSRCWETRDLLKEEQHRIAIAQYEDKDRDLTSYLNNWNIIKELNKR